jgi:hypothetical protein
MVVLFPGIACNYIISSKAIKKKAKKISKKHLHISQNLFLAYSN